MADRIYTHTGVVNTMDAGKRRVPLYLSGKYWRSDRCKFDHNGNAFGTPYDKLLLKTIRKSK